MRWDRATEAEDEAPLTKLLQAPSLRRQGQWAAGKGEGHRCLELDPFAIGRSESHRQCRIVFRLVAGDIVVTQFIRAARGRGNLCPPRRADRWFERNKRTNFHVSLPLGARSSSARFC